MWVGWKVTVRWVWFFLINCGSKVPALFRGVFSSKLPDVDLMVLRVLSFLRLEDGTLPRCCPALLYVLPRSAV